MGTVRQVLDAMLVLDLKIVLICSCDCFGSQPFHFVVDIYEEWHEPALLHWCGARANGYARP